MSSDYMEEKEMTQDVLDDDAIPAVQGQFSSINEISTCNLLSIDALMFLNPPIFSLSLTLPVFVRFRVRENTNPGNNDDVYLRLGHFFYQMDEDD
jgi:hypothetical protein